MPTAEEISRLKTGTAQEKLEALSRLDGKSSGADLQLLFEAMSDPLWVVRKHACELLGACGNVILEPLSKLLATGTEDQKFWTVKALVSLGKDAVPVLVHALTRGGKTMRIYAAQALGELGDPVAIPHLIQGLGDETWRVRKNSYDSLVLFKDQAFEPLRHALASDNEDMVFWSAKALGKLGEKSREVLLRGLREGNQQLKFIIAAALGETGDARIIGLLIRNLKEGSWIIQKRSADALAEIGARALPGLEEGLLSSQPPQDFWLISALARIRPAGPQVLERLFIQQGESFRWEHREALAKIGEPLLPLYEVLVKNREQEVRFFAVSCLGELKASRRADDLLLEALSDSSWSVRKLAGDVLADRGPAMLDRLNLALETGSEDLRFWVTYIFSRMGDPGLNYLIKGLTDSNKNIAYFAASALGEVRQPGAVRPLIRALGDSTWPVRKNASESLVQLKDFSVSQLINFVNDEDEDIQYWVLKTLKTIGEEALPETIQILKKGTNEERCFAARVLGELEVAKAAEPLAEALADGHEWVRQYAALALARLGDARAVTHFVSSFDDITFKLHPAIFEVFETFGEAALPMVHEALASKKPAGMRNALRVLGRIRADESFDRIREFLDNRQEDVKIAAVEAIAAYSHRSETVPILTGLAAEAQNPRVRTRIYLALAETGSDAALIEVLKAVFASEENKERKRLLEILQRNPERLTLLLIQLMGSEKIAYRKPASDFLVEHLGERCRGAVESAMNHEDKNVRFWASKVLKQLSDRGGS